MFTGLWDCFTSQEVVDMVRYQISLGATLAQTSAFICNTCVAPAKAAFSAGTDNTTIIIIAFLHGKTRTGWMKWITERVERNADWSTLSSIPQIYGLYKPLMHPAHIATDFDFALPPPAEPISISFA